MLISPPPRSRRFDSYLYKTVVPGNPVDDVKLLVRTVASMVRANALRDPASKGVTVDFGARPLPSASKA